MKYNRYIGGVAVIDDIFEEAAGIVKSSVVDGAEIGMEGLKGVGTGMRTAGDTITGQLHTAEDFNSNYNYARIGGSRRLTRRKYRRKTKRKTRKKKKSKRKTRKRYTKKQKKTKKKYIRKKRLRKGGTMVIGSVVDGITKVAKKSFDTGLGALKKGVEEGITLERKTVGKLGSFSGKTVKITSESIVKSLNAIEGVTSFTIDMGEGTGNTVIVISENLGNSIDKIGSVLGTGAVSSIEELEKVSENILSKSDETLRSLGNSGQKILQNLSNIIEEVSTKGTLTIENLVSSGVEKVEKVGEFTSSGITKCICLPLKVGEKGTGGTKKLLMIVTETGSHLIEWSDDLISFPINSAENTALKVEKTI